MKFRFPSQPDLALLRETYCGKRVKLIRMTDPLAPLPPGSLGLVDRIDDAGTLHMAWDNGRTLGLIVGEDEFELVANPFEPST